MAATATREEIESRVFSALEEFGAEPDQINPDATFESLDIDSLDIAELAQIIDEKFGVEIKSSDAEQIKTVGDVVDLVAARS
jgi:acyl carrier protein